MKDNPDLRFGQILQAFDFVKVKEIEENVSNSRQDTILIWENEFYLESEALLKRIKRE